MIKILLNHIKHKKSLKMKCVATSHEFSIILCILQVDKMLYCSVLVRDATIDTVTVIRVTFPAYGSW